VKPAKPRDATVSVRNPESECPVYRLLAGLFDDDVVSVRDATTDTEYHKKYFRLLSG